MELNREQIVKALECCTSSGKSAECPIGCPFGDINSCEESLMYHALALIRELTEENEKLRAEHAPKKPRFYDTKFRQRGRKYGELVTIERAYNCPKCNSTVWETDKRPYCNYCGQPLDWGETKGENKNV